MLKEIFTISKYPYLKLNSDREFIDKLGRVFKAYGFVLLALIFIAAPIVTLTDNFVVHVLHFKTIQYQDKNTLKQLLEKSHYFALVYIALIGPIIEETVFRLPLSFKRTHIAISVAFAFFIFGSQLPGNHALNIEFGKWFIFVIRVGITLGLFFTVRRFLPVDIQLSDRAKKSFIILSICLFGLIHISNFSPLQWPILWIYPLYVLPQIFMGWLITYIRFKNGFIWGIMLHCLINSVVMLFLSGDVKSIKVKPAHNIITKSKIDSNTTIKLPVSAGSLGENFSLRSK
jgi:hypothetical protein